MSKYRKAFGKIFVAENGALFGVVREPGASRPRELASENVIASDGCGNYFFCNVPGEVLFWDHETRESVAVAPNAEVFVRNCVSPTSIVLPPHQAMASWIDPAFERTNVVTDDDDEHKGSGA